MRDKIVFMLVLSDAGLFDHAALLCLVLSEAGL